MVQSTPMSAEWLSLINIMGLSDCRLFLLPSAQNLMVYYRPRGGNLAMAFLCDRMLVIHGGSKPISSLKPRFVSTFSSIPRSRPISARGSFLCLSPVFSASIYRLSVFASLTNTAILLSSIISTVLYLTYFTCVGRCIITLRCPFCL
jgi:hypothetical protein